MFLKSLWVILCDPTAKNGSKLWEFDLNSNAHTVLNNHHRWWNSDETRHNIWVLNPSSETFGITYKLNSTRYTTTIESGAPVEDQTMENTKTFLSASCFNERRVSVLQSYSRSTQTWCFSHRQTFPPQMSVNKTFDISASHPCSHSGHKYKNAHTNSCSGWNPLIDDEPTSNPSSVLWNEPWDASFPPVAWNTISGFGVIVSGVLLLNMQSSLFSDIIRVNRRTESNESRMWRRWTEFCNKKLNKCFCYFLSDETELEAEPDRRWSKAHVGQWLFT